MVQVIEPHQPKSSFCLVAVRKVVLICSVTAIVLIALLNLHLHWGIFSIMLIFYVFEKVEQDLAQDLQKIRKDFNSSFENDLKAMGVKPSTSVLHENQGTTIDVPRERLNPFFKKFIIRQLRDLLEFKP